MSARFKHKRMYAVSLDRVGIIAGTMAYSRRGAIMHFLGEPAFLPEWEIFKRSGYRTVMAKIQVIDKRASRVPSDQRG